ncbi:hypothetical protein KI387_037164, partial [Taxus chinensis]
DRDQTEVQTELARELSLSGKEGVRVKAIIPVDASDHHCSTNMGEEEKEAKKDETQVKSTEKVDTPHVQ